MPGEDGLTVVQTLVGPKTAAEIRAEVTAAAASAGNQDIEAALGKAIVAADDKKLEVLTGRNLAFDPEAFIKKGVIRKTNLTILPDLVIDMETITQQRRAFAERLVRAHVGESAEDNSYRTLLDTALLAVAITRMNSQEFPVPDLLNMGTPENQAAVDGKALLYRLLLNSNKAMIDTLTAVYNSLEGADVLVEHGEPEIKK